MLNRRIEFQYQSVSLPLLSFDLNEQFHCFLELCFQLACVARVGFDRTERTLRCPNNAIPVAMISPFLSTIICRYQLCCVCTSGRILFFDDLELCDTDSLSGYDTHLCLEDRYIQSQNDALVEFAITQSKYKRSNHFKPSISVFYGQVSREIQKLEQTSVVYV